MIKLIAIAFVIIVGSAFIGDNTKQIKASKEVLIDTIKLNKEIQFFKTQTSINQELFRINKIRLNPKN